MPTPVPPPKSVLTPWQRPLVKALVLGGIFLAATGLFLAGTPGGSPSASGAFVLHVIVGVLLVPVLFVFTLPHAIAQTRRKPLIALSGALVLLAALALVGSGASLLLDPVRTGRGVAWLVHVVAGFGLLLLYVLHRVYGSNPASPKVLAAGLASVVGLAAGLLLWEKSDPGRVSVFESANAEGAELSRVHFFPSLAASGVGGVALTADDIRDVKSCATCHRQIAFDWQRSAHRHASMTNPMYRASIEDLRKRFPKTDARWCAACHDPALLFSSEPKSGLSKIAAPELDMESADARTGLSCIACHAIDPQSTNGNGDYVIRSRKIYPGEKSENAALVKAHDVLLRLKPSAHAKSLTPKNIREGAYCSVCHKAEPPPELDRWKWVRAQDEYDAWDDSGVSMGNARSFYHPPKAKSCQDCHMPLVADRDDPTADADGMVHSHLFAAANSSLPHLRGDTDMIEKTAKFLSTSCRVDITGIELSGGRKFYPAPAIRPAVAPGEVVQADVVVRNVGVGHRFPGGTVDSNEVWLDFEARVGDGDVFYASGKVDPVTREVDPSAEFYRSYWLRRDGTRFTSRVANDLYTFIYVKRIGPGAADVVRYRLKVPDGASGELNLKATLRYRKFALPILETVAKNLGAKDGLKVTVKRESEYLVPMEPFIADLREMPILDMATGTLSLPITAEGTKGQPPAPESLGLKIPDDRDRVNDLAIALLVQREFVGAREVFEAVTRIDPKYPDGFVNVGRAALELQDLDGAWTACAKALEVASANPKVPFHPAKAFFFQAQVARNRTAYAQAEALYRRVLEKFPRDRETHRRLADVLYQQQKYAESLAVVDSMLKIDPEDWEIWYWAMRCYQDLGDESRAAAALAAHDRFRNDDDNLARSAPTTLADPSLHNLAQLLHVHEQKGLSARDR